MPAAPRPEGKAKKIAYAIMGIPANMIEKRPTKEDKRIARILLYEETLRSR